MLLSGAHLELIANTLNHALVELRIAIPDVSLSRPSFDLYLQVVLGDLLLLAAHPLVVVLARAVNLRLIGLVRHRLFHFLEKRIFRIFISLLKLRYVDLIKIDTVLELESFLRGRVVHVLNVVLVLLHYLIHF